MFLNLLDDAQKSAFLALATQVVRADGRLATEEFSLMADVQTEVGWDVAPKREDLDGEVDLSVFTTRQAQMVCVMVLMVLAICDGHLADQEDDLIGRVCDTFGFTSGERSGLMSWAREAAPLLVEGYRVAMSGKVERVG